MNIQKFQAAIWKTIVDLLAEVLADVQAEKNSDSDVESDVGSDHELIYSEDSDEED